MALVKEFYDDEFLNNFKVSEVARELVVHGDSLQTALNIVSLAGEQIPNFNTISEEDAYTFADLIEQIIRYYAVTHSTEEIPFEEGT